MAFKKYSITFCLLLLLRVLCSCTPNTSPANHKKVATQSAILTKPHSTAINDELLFKQFLLKFKKAVKQKNKTVLLGLLYYPLQTNPQWSNADLKNTTINYKDGLLTRQEIPQYTDDIFSTDVVRLVPLSTEDDLSEIDSHSDENYYLELRKLTDKGSALYELQKQYTQDNGKETSFGFVFGKVKGTYKVLSYYTPWPLKG